MQKFLPYFPLSASVLSGNAKSLIISLAIYLVACAILGVLNAILGWIPLAGVIIGAICSLLGLYCVAGMVLSVLNFLQR